ncbi:MAG: glutathione S-transferase family protein [Rhodospirillaceae bacterium]|jgi:glutathione S-transferase
MIDLYAAPTTNGLRVKITLDECGLDYNLHRVNMAEKEHKSEAFLKLNPLGQTPVIIDQDAPGGPLTMCQSMAIMFYVCEKAGKFIPTDPAQRASFWEPAMHAATEIGPGYGAIPFITRWEKENQHAKDMFQSRYRLHMEHTDKILSRQKYYAGDEVTLADFAAFGIITRGKSTFPEMSEGYTNIDRWHDELAARPGVQKGLDFGG